MKKRKFYINWIEKFYFVFFSNAIYILFNYKKNELITQEISDKKWIAEHIAKLERENNRLKEAINSITLKKKQQTAQIIQNINDKQKTLPKYQEEEEAEESREESQYEPPNFQ